MRKLILAALLATSLVTPATLIQAEASTKSLVETVGERFRGIADEGSQRWPFQVYDINVSDEGDFDATINWPRQNSEQKIEGTFHNGILTFTETDVIRKGDSRTGCDFQIDTKGASNGQAEGQWGHCSGSSEYGKVQIFLPIVNEWTPNPNSAKKSKGPDLDTAGQITAWADYAEANCVGLGVDHPKLEAFVKSAGATMSEAKQSAAYKKATSELIPHDVSKYGVQQFCYLLQLQFYQPANLQLHKLIFKY